MLDKDITSVGRELVGAGGDTVCESKGLVGRLDGPHPSRGLRLECRSSILLLVMLLARGRLSIRVLGGGSRGVISGLGLVSSAGDVRVRMWRAGGHPWSASCWVGRGVVAAVVGVVAHRLCASYECWVMLFLVPLCSLVWLNESENEDEEEEQRKEG